MSAPTAFSAYPQAPQPEDSGERARLLPPLRVPEPERKGALRVAAFLWFLGLVPGMSLMGLYSHLGADANVSLGKLVSAEQLLRAGTVAVCLWLLVLSLCAAAAGLDTRRRRWLPQVVLLSVLVLASGVFLSMGITLATAHWDALWIQRLSSLGGFVALVCWLRSLSLAARH